MSSEENGKKAKIIVLSIILAIVVIFIIVVAVVEIVKLNKKNAPPPPPPVEEEVIEEPEEPPKQSVFSNSYNEAITRKILTDDAYDYRGTYAFSSVTTPIFDSSVTDEQKQQFWNENGCRNPNDYLKKINDEKFAELQGVTITIDKPYNPETGSNETFGTYTYNSASKTLTGKVYGDRNLAVLVQDNTDDTEYWFISLNYKRFTTAVDVDETTYFEAGKIYLFENHYKNGTLFYSLTYTYTLV